MKPSSLRLEICGGIASGKTTLARALAAGIGAALVLEDFRSNPFWERFYQRPELFFREKNICFLTQHVGEIKAAGGGDLVCDFGVVQDLAYAALGGDPEHLAVMRRLYEHLYLPLATPRLIVHLQCDEAEQLRRIQQRGRAEEGPISLAYLQDLNAALGEALRSPQRPACRVIEVRSDRIDFAHDVEQARQLIRTICPGEGLSSIGAP